MGFNADRVTTGIQKLQTAHRKKSQKRMDRCVMVCSVYPEKLWNSFNSFYGWRFDDFSTTFCLSFFLIHSSLLFLFLFHFILRFFLFYHYHYFLFLFFSSFFTSTGVSTSSTSLKRKADDAAGKGVTKKGAKAAPVKKAGSKPGPKKRWYFIVAEFVVQCTVQCYARQISLIEPPLYFFEERLMIQISCGCHFF